ncbi:MAG TPA: hypothetical protein VND21_07270 [Planctomycetota bacterium]|nr:hypothetical protein [Planctomycetota bacterium]
MRWPRRRWTVPLGVAAVGLAVFLVAGRSWAHRHVRQFANAGDPASMDCTRCHGPKAGVTAERRARPTPSGLAVSADGRFAYAVSAPQRRVLVVDLVEQAVVASVEGGGEPSGVALSPDGRTLAITLVDRHEVVLADAKGGAVRARHATGTEPAGVAFDAAGRRLFVANAGSDDVSVLDLDTGHHVRRPAGHEPFVVVRSPDGATIAVVARRASLGAPDRVPASEVTLFDAATGATRRRVMLASCHMAEGAAFTPDGRRLLTPVVEVHNLLPILEVARGWVSGASLACVDVATGDVALLPLNEPTRGFADPAGVAVAADGRRALVLSGGSDEVGIVDLAAALREEGASRPDAPRRLSLALRYVERREPLRNNPRAIVAAGDRYVVAERLADSIATLDAEGHVVARTVLDDAPPDALRRGERVFHDAGATFQGHFSCRGCHPGAHTDGLTYDFELDGVGRNAVLNRSLHGLAGTEPFKWIGTNPTLERQCGPRFAMVLSRADVFSEEALRDLVAWMHSLPPPRPRPNAGIVTGIDTAAAERGRRLFERSVRKDGTSLPPSGRCVTCHPLPHGTNNKKADVGTRGPTDGTGTYDIPHLTGIATKAPYLHDARATTLEEIWTLPGVLDQHGVVTDFSKADLNDLIEFLRGL